jgi:hypothetical protein
MRCLRVIYRNKEEFVVRKEVVLNVQNCGQASRLTAPGYRRSDITLDHAYDKSKSVHIDVCYVNPASKDKVLAKHSDQVDLASASYAERAKVLKYEQAFDSEFVRQNCVMFAVETAGALGKSAASFLSSCKKSAGSDKTEQKAVNAALKEYAISAAFIDARFKYLMVQAGLKMLQGVLAVTGPVQLDTIENPDLDVFPQVEYQDNFPADPLHLHATHTAAAVSPAHVPTQDQNPNVDIGQVFGSVVDASV